MATGGDAPPHPAIAEAPVNLLSIPVVSVTPLGSEAASTYSLPCSPVHPQSLPSPTAVLPSEHAQYNSHVMEGLVATPGGIYVTTEAVQATRSAPPTPEQTPQTIDWLNMSFLDNDINGIIAESQGEVSNLLTNNLISTNAPAAAPAKMKVNERFK